MKRKKIFFFIAFLCVSTISFFSFNYWKKAQAPIEVPHLFKTWSTFTEIKRLQMLLKGFGIQSILDIPSCDIETLIHLDLGAKVYIGIADKKKQASLLQAEFGDQFRTFISLKPSIDRLPKADLIMCWDKLCTLPLDQIPAALLQFKKSGAKFLLMRHYPEIKENRTSQNQTFQPINWKLAPFHFPEPIIQIMEKKEHTTEYLALWNLSQI